MQTNNTFTVILFTRKSRGNSKKLEFYARITVNGKRSEISLKRSISVCNCDTSKGKARGTTEKIRILNKYLDHVYGQVLDCWNVYLTFDVKSKLLDLAYQIEEAQPWRKITEH